MTEETRNFLGKLKTVRTKAAEEGRTTMCIYQRIARGLYDTIEIDGVKFIVGEGRK